MKVKLPYRTVNQLDEYIKLEKQNRMSVGDKCTQKDIIQEIADECSVSWNTVNHIRKNINQPSIGLALKISKFFNVKVEDMFYIEDQPS